RSLLVVLRRFRGGACDWRGFHCAGEQQAHAASSDIARTKTPGGSGDLSQLAYHHPLRVVQLSDCHLFAEESGKLLGLETQFSLDRVLELIRAEQPRIDLILATGDLSQDASQASYERLQRALAGFNTPTYWLEGNHDKPAPMLAALKAD